MAGLDRRLGEAGDVPGPPDHSLSLPPPSFAAARHRHRGHPVSGMIARDCGRGRAVAVFAVALAIAAPAAASIDDGDWFDDYSPVYDEAPYRDDYRPFEASGPSFDAEIRSAADEMDSLGPEELEVGSPSGVAWGQRPASLNSRSPPAPRSACRTPATSARGTSSAP